MKIDLTCPVELWQTPKVDSEKPECTFVLNNLSEKTVVSVQVTLACHDAEGELLFRQIERIQGLHAGSGERFPITILPTQWENASSVELTAEKVWFDDATIWRKGNAPLISYESNALPNGRKLEQLRFVAGKDAVGYPVEGEHIWVCVCGRTNAKPSDRCCRCGRRAKVVFASFSQQTVQQINAAHEEKLREIAKKAREEASRLAEARENVRQKKAAQKRKLMRLSALAAGLALVVAAAIIWGLPVYYDYRAEALLKDQQFDAARAAFTAMNKGEETAQQLLRCDYSEAQAWLAAGDAESLPLAEEAFAKLGEYEDSPALRKQAVYLMGALALEGRDYPTAMAHFDSLGEYEDSPEKVREIKYIQAGELFDAEEYTQAETIFRTLGEYRDSAARVPECRYQIGLAAEKAGEYQAAIDRWEALGEDYQDVKERLPRVYYLLAEEKHAASDFEAAGNLYLKAGEYENAPLKANDSLYQFAQERFQGGDYEKARALFEQIIPYLDSESMSFDSIYWQAEKARIDGDFDSANRLFASIPQHKDATEKRKESQYRLAIKNMSQGDLDAAEALFVGAADYQDSAKLLRQVRHQLAESAAEAGEYQRAVDLFELLGNYQDSATQLKDCRYQLAHNAGMNGDFETAIAQYSLLGKYEDANQRLQAAYYDYAMKYKADGNIEKTIENLTLAGDYGTAAQDIIDITLEEAQKKKDEGDDDDATALLDSLAGVPEADALRNVWQYAAALKLKVAEQYVEAGALFMALGEHQDAKAQAEECYDLYYGVVAEPARAAFEQKDYLTVITTLDGFVMDDLPEAYSDLPTIYAQACNAYADELFDAGKPYEALPYYQRIPEYRGVRQKLDRSCYLLLGKWKNDKGETAEFYADGTCKILGESFAFNVNDLALSTGPNAESLTLTHRLTDVSQKALTLRDTRDGQRAVYKFDRVAEAETTKVEPKVTPAPTETPKPAQTEATEKPVQEEAGDAASTR